MSAVSKQRGLLYLGALYSLDPAGPRSQMRLIPIGRLVDVNCTAHLQSCSSCRSEVAFHQLRAQLKLPTTWRPLESLQEAQSLPSRFDARSGPIPFTSVCLSAIVIS